MASGFAYQVGKSMGYYKQAVTGSRLSLKQMPKRAGNVILHTRLATHGSITDNRNNHPVLSPSQDIALVHNGVIYNHEEVRLKVTGELPDVDTSVIPAVIEQLGVNSLDVLDGDAAIAWFDRNDPETLHLARYQHSPLTICQVEDGSFVFASTQVLLDKALKRVGLKAIWYHTSVELEYYQVSNGVIHTKQELPAPKFTYNAYDYSYFRHQTAGAKSKSSGVVTDIRYYDAWDDYLDEDSTYFTVQKYDDSDIGLPSYDPEVSRYWITVADNTTGEQFTQYFTKDEFAAYEDECWDLLDSSSFTLMGYGPVVDGQKVNEYQLF
jgi:hypothetical protein